MLDTLLERIPDQLDVGDRKPDGRTLVGDPSNSIPDWTRTLGLDDLKDDLLLIESDDNMSQMVPVPSNEHDDNYVSNSCIFIPMGSGHSPDHSLL